MVTVEGEKQSDSFMSLGGKRRHTGIPAAPDASQTQFSVISGRFSGYGAAAGAEMQLYTHDKCFNTSSAWKGDFPDTV